ncbi:MAG TPA: peptide chain release factor N(5)-glutamine methyltransferase [Pseudolabrys sp.]|nr:peptide chain release factor N(5)-glutamine methyltransferase [Pseudolabrys sp.]
MRTIPGLKDGASVSEALNLLAQAFRMAGIEDADVDARLLVGYALHLDRARLIAQSDRILEAREINVINALAARRLKREPVSRILGQKEFWSIALAITPDVLVPRPETETIVEGALDFVVRGGLRMEKLRILDIGTGSGALLLALLRELPNATGTGTDISTGALKVARENAARCGVEGRCTFVVCDIASVVEGPFDLIVSNPPYIAHDEITSLAPEVKNYDPTVALDGGDDGLAAYRGIAADARRLLAPGSRMFVELGAGQEAAVRDLFTNVGLIAGIARTDLAGIPRVLGAGFVP